MTQEPLRGVTAMFLRSFAIQGAFNYRTLVGMGFAFALLPVLRRVYAGRPDALAEALRRHSGLFNSHPYLAGIALGGVARMEAEGERPEVIDRFKVALRGSLGALGDRLVWAGWRPICVSLALLLFLSGAPWWSAVAGFLILYNAGHLALRWWAFRLGTEHGLRVGERLRGSRLVLAQDRLPIVGSFLLGALLPITVLAAADAVQPGLVGGGAAIAAAAIGIRLGPAVRMPIGVLLGCVLVAGLLLRSQA
jgi:mannose PTS system EIID component